MLDAAQAAIVKLRRRPNVRRILLLISESRDRGSETDLRGVALAAQSSALCRNRSTRASTSSRFGSTGAEITVYGRDPATGRRGRRGDLREAFQCDNV